MSAKIWIVREMEFLDNVAFVVVGGLQYLLHGLVVVVVRSHHQRNCLLEIRKTKRRKEKKASLPLQSSGSSPRPMPIDSAELSMNCC